MNGKISNNKEGKFNTVSIIGKLIFEIPMFVKNFTSSNIFKIKIRDVKINVI
tara:strand:- start:221 stop:376 length:156 start_codon:yes stop_codon:yes gene_type:complete